MVDNITGMIISEDLINQVKSLTLLFQTLGGLAIAYLVFNIVSIIFQRKKNKELKRIAILLEKIEKKLK